MIENRYIRQTTLNEVGDKGQNKIANARVLVIGCGGLGSEAAVHLAGSGVGYMHLVDYDKIEISNLHRQVFYKELDVHKFKSEVLADYILSINSSVKVSFDSNKIEKGNIRELISEYDYVIDCTDDLNTKYLINDACVLENKVLVYGSLHKFEGHVAVFNSKEPSGNRTTSLRDIYPEIPTENIPSCSEVGTLNPIVSIIANMQVNEVLKLILGIGKPLVNKMFIYNVLDYSQMILKLKVNIELEYSNIWKSNNYNTSLNKFCSVNEITQDEFRKRLNDQDVKVISVLEEVKSFDFRVDFHFPFSHLDIEKIRLEKDDYVVICKKGITSLKAIVLLNEKYHESSFKSLKGGIESLS